jgi:hypothetical protein
MQVEALQKEDMRWPEAQKAQWRRTREQTNFVVDGGAMMQSWKYMYMVRNDSNSSHKFYNNHLWWLFPS